MPGGSGAVAAYGSTLSPPSTMATGIAHPRFFQLRQWRAPSWCMCQCIAAWRLPKICTRYMPMLWLAGRCACSSSAWMVWMPASVM